jgi:hypothetical protein
MAEGLFGVVEDLLVGGAEGGGLGAGFAGAGVAVVAGEGAAGHLDPDAVAASEAVGRAWEDEAGLDSVNGSMIVGPLRAIAWEAAAGSGV